MSVNNKHSSLSGYRSMLFERTTKPFSVTEKLTASVVRLSTSMQMEATIKTHLFLIVSVFVDLQPGSLMKGKSPSQSKSISSTFGFSNHCCMKPKVTALKAILNQG